jgi:hypothetical protein
VERRILIWMVPVGANLSLLKLPYDIVLSLESNVNSKNIFNITEIKDNYGNREFYYLIEQFVDKHRKEASICKSCRDFISENKLPTYCIASGYDFGNLNSIDLPQLNYIEKSIISPYRRYDKIFKLVANKNFSNDSLQSALKGQIFHIEHDGPEKIAEVLPNIGGTDSIMITFVGTANQWAREFKRLRKSKEFVVSGNLD